MDGSPKSAELALRAGRGLADPVRLTLFEALCDGPKPVRELAGVAGLPADRLYHHLDLLEEAGLIRVRTSRPRRVYEALTEAPDIDPQQSAAVAGAVLEAARVELTAVLARASKGPGGRRAMLARAALRLSAERMQELQTRLAELFDEFAQDSGELRVRILGAVYPVLRP